MEKIKEKATKNTTVMAATFPSMSAPLARKKAAALAEEGIEGFSIMPMKAKGYICVGKTVESQEEADKLIQEGASKGISLDILK